MVVNREMMAVLFEYCHVRRYAKGSVLYDKDRGRGTLSFIVSGSVVVTIEPKGRKPRVIFWRLYPGEMFGCECIVNHPCPDRYVIKARTDMHVAEVSGNTLNELLMTRLSDYRDSFLKAVISDYAARQFEYLRRAETIWYRDAYYRVMDSLTRLSRYPDAEVNEEGTTVRVSVTELAQMSGCSREMAGKVLRELVENGLLRRNGYRYEILLLGKRMDSLAGDAA